MKKIIISLVFLYSSFVFCSQPQPVVEVKIENHILENKEDSTITTTAPQLCAVISVNPPSGFQHITKRLAEVGIVIDAQISLSNTPAPQQQ